MASEALGLLPGEMQEHFPAGDCMVSIPNNEARCFACGSRLTLPR